MKRIFLALWLIGLLSVTLVPQEKERIFKIVLNKRAESYTRGRFDATVTKYTLFFGPSMSYSGVDFSSGTQTPELENQARAQFNQYSFEVFTAEATQARIDALSNTINGVGSYAKGLNDTINEVGRQFNELRDQTLPAVEARIQNTLAGKFAEMLQIHYGKIFTDKFMETLKSEIKSEVEKQKKAIRDELINDPYFRQELLEKLKEDLKGLKND